VCQAYGPLDRSELVPTTLWWQRRCADDVRRQAAWTAEHAEELARFL
jgi:hypothetical protein